MQSAMTKILRTDADVCFTPDVSADIWKDLGTALGFSAATIAATTVIASGASPIPAAPPSMPARPPNPPTVSVVQGGSQMLSTALAVGAGVAAIAVSTVLLKPAVDHANIAQVPQESVSLVEILPPDLPTTQTPQQESSLPEIILPPGKVEILIEHETLHYPAGSAPSPGQILQDAGARCLDENGDEIELVVAEYEQVDFQTPDDYYVYLEAPDGQAIPRVVIISVE